MAAPENPAVLAVRVVLENPVAQVALARQVVAVLPSQVEAELVSQVGVVEKEAQTRSVAISRPVAAVAVAPLLAGVGALLKPRATAVAVA